MREARQRVQEDLPVQQQRVGGGAHGGGAEHVAQQGDLPEVIAVAQADLALSHRVEQIAAARVTGEIPKV